MSPITIEPQAALACGSRSFACADVDGLAQAYQQLLALDLAERNQFQQVVRQ